MKRTYVFSFALAVAFFILNAAVWVYLENSRLYQQDIAYATAQSELSTNATALVSTINRKDAIMKGFYSFINNQGVHVDSGRLDDFQRHLLDNTTGIVNTALTNGETVTYVYPNDENINKMVIGYNFFEDARPEVRADAIRMRNSQKVIVSGPYELLDGGLGLIERRAIIERGQYAGSVSLVMSLDQILSEAGLNHIDKPIDIAVRKPGKPAFFGNDAIFTGRKVLSYVTLSEGYWETAAKPKDEVLQTIDRSIRIQKWSVLISSLLLYLLIYSVVGSRRRLKSLVEIRTEDLNRTNLELKETNQSLRESERNLTALVYNDLLTGIFNRTFLNERLKAAVADGASSPALLLLDLDRFKLVNDTFGHSAGDELLRKWVSRMLDADLGYDVFARMGGDEFVFLLYDCKDEGIVEQMARTIIEVTQAPFFISDMELQIGASIGIVFHTPGGNLEEDLLKNADTAMYRVKGTGGNGFSLFDTSMAVDVMKKVQWAGEIRHALREEHFELYYQPQVDSRTNTIVGVEALLRWNKQGHGFVSPQQFIPIAEETGLILYLSEWVLRQACRQMKAWNDKGMPPIRMAVNLSASLFHQSDLEERIHQIVAETGLPMHQLEFEITENIAIMDEHFAFLNRMLELGASIAIDDFGTQYSSLSYLKRFPITKIKIDKSFIDGIGISSKDEAIIQAMVLVAKQLGLHIVAEGVETEEQVEFLRKLDCYQVQGYYYYKPMPKGQTEQLLLNLLDNKLFKS